MKILSYGIGIIILGYLYFNRQPIRTITPGNNFTAPADGTVISVKNNKIEIFLSLTDVHYQRSPADGQVINITNLPSSEKPMYSVIELETKLGYIVIERWGGELARTVTTIVEPYQYVKKGDIIGRILLGSHVAITIPSYMEIKVRPYQHLTAGETIIAVPIS